MDNRASIPARFKAESKPSEGLVRIEDTMTGREGTIRLRCYQSVASLLSDLFPGDEAAEAPAAKAAPAAEPVARGPAPQPEPEKRPETTASGMDVIDTGSDDEDEDPKSLAEKVFGGLFGEPDDAPLPPETPKAKKKPGRPKKTAAEKVAEQPAEQTAPEEAKAKKKPGRPKKAAAEKAQGEAAEQSSTPVEEPKAKKKPGRPKKSTTTKAAEAIAEEAPAKPARAKKAPKKAAPKKSVATAAKSPSGAKEVIEEPNYKLVLDEQASEPTYTILKRDGTVFGKVQLEGKEAHLIPEPSDRFRKTKHKSLMGAQSRIDMLIEVEDEEL